MSDVIDLTTERNRREGPDPEHIRHDDRGRPLFEFVYDYTMDDGSFSFSLFAYDFEDAERRANAINQGVKLTGQLYGVDPA
mgnify:CR=1 FL=1